MDTNKQTSGASERNEEEREAFRQLIATLPPEQLVIVDERSTPLCLTSRSARAPPGQRAYAHVPRTQGKTARCWPR